MNGLERIVAAIGFQYTDRVPVIAQVFGHAAMLAGAPLDNYVSDGELLAQCQLQAWKRYGYDAVFSVMGTNVETEAAGSILKYRKNQYPTIERYALSTGGNWGLLSVPDPFQEGRLPEMLKALSILRRELDDRALIVGCVPGPFTLAAQLLGLENTLYLAIDDAPCLERLMDYATEVIISFGLAQLQSGAHLPLVFDPSASPAVVPPNFFREFELPRLQRVFRAFKGAGAIANWLHIAGPAVPILSYYPLAGVDMANFDYEVSASDAGRELPATCLDGNIRPLAFVDGTPDMIKEEARRLLRFFQDRRGFVLSSGCEIPLESRPENIAAMVTSAHEGWK